MDDEKGSNTASIIAISFIVLLVVSSVYFFGFSERNTSNVLIAKTTLTK